MNRRKTSGTPAVKRRGELLKNLVIVLLFICAVFLGWQSRLFGNAPEDVGSLTELLQELSGKTAGSGQDDSPRAAEPAKPVAIAVTGGDGGHYGVRYDMRELDQMYRSTALFFSQALGTAQPVRKTDGAAWRSALKSPGVYYEYASPVKLFILGRWLGADVSGTWGGIPVRMLCVTEAGDETKLFFRNDATGEYYEAEAAVRGDIGIAADDYGSNGAVFAFEIVPGSKAPGMLLLPDTPGYPQIEASNPLSDKTKRDKVLLNLGVSDLGHSFKSGDTEKFVGEDFNLDISSNGVVSYRRTAEAGASYNPPDEADAILMAYLAVSAQLGNYCGDAAVYYHSSSALPGGGYRVLFRYIVAGGAVWLYRDGYAASVTVKGGEISAMTLCFRSYTVSNTITSLLPEIQAAAAADRDYMLGYHDNGSGPLLPEWVKLPLG